MPVTDMTRLETSSGDESTSDPIAGIGEEEKAAARGDAGGEEREASRDTNPLVNGPPRRQIGFLALR
jgi:hypothetical protein